MKYPRPTSCLLVSLLCLLGLFEARAGAPAPYGIEARVPNTTLLISAVPDGDTVPEGFPINLSDMPALLAAGLGQDQTTAGIYPYAPSAKLWTDGALKERFFALPGEAQLSYRVDTGWDLPEGAIVIKNFLLPEDFRDPVGTAQRVETRLLIRNGGMWHGFSYRWNEEGTDAVLLDDGDTRAFTLTDAAGMAFSYDWAFPRRTQCFRCHTSAANVVLGLNTAQMNADFTYPASGVRDNQLRTYEHLGLFEGGLPAEPCALPKAPDSEDESEPVAARALAYLHANCSMCHRPDGGTPTAMDLRWGQRLEARTLFDALPERYDLGLTEARILAPGTPASSVLLARLADVGAHRMPPLGTSLVDEAGADLLAAWITEQTSIDGRQHSYHSADTNQDARIGLPELLRVIQFYNTGEYGCDTGSEDGYAVDGNNQSCTPHAGDYDPADWEISLGEVLRVIQLYNMNGYTGAAFTEAEDGYLPGSPCGG